MSSVNYSLNHKGVRLFSSDDAWVKSKNGKRKLNPKIRFIGKINTTIPNLIISATDDKKPKFKGNTCDLNRTAKQVQTDKKNKFSKWKYPWKYK